MAVTHGLEESDYDQCFACRRPITEDEKLKPEYQKGISCHHCHEEMTESQKAAFAERQKQIQLAKARGDVHIGRKAS